VLPPIRLLEEISLRVLFGSVSMPRPTWFTRWMRGPWASAGTIWPRPSPAWRNVSLSPVGPP